MEKTLGTAYAFKHEQGGRKSKLSVENQLMLTLEYWRQYVTFAELGFRYGVAESTAHDIVIWVGDILVKSGKFALPGKKALLEDRTLEVVLLDVMESPVERPKKTNPKRPLFRQEEKAHTKNFDFREQKNS